MVSGVKIHWLIARKIYFKIKKKARSYESKIVNHVQIMSKLELKTPEPLNFDDAGKEWPLWKQKFKIFLIASGKNKEDEKTKISFFLTYIGEKGIEIYNTLFDKPFDPDDDEDEFLDASDADAADAANRTDNGSNENTETISLKLVLEKFEEYCLPKKNIVMESFKFNIIVQKENQPFSEYLTELRTQMKYCDYTCAKCKEPYTDRMLKEKLILGLFDKKLQIKLLETSKNTLGDVIEKCKIAELAVTNKKLLNN